MTLREFNKLKNKVNKKEFLVHSGLYSRVYVYDDGSIEYQSLDDGYTEVLLIRNNTDIVRAIKNYKNEITVERLSGD